MITGLDHLYLSVSDFSRSEIFYDRVLAGLGFKKGDKPVGGDAHAHYFNPSLQISIRPAQVEQKHDPYAPGVHHICLQADNRAAVDTIEELLRGLGVDVVAAADYPEYNDDYYALFFEDPDGIRFEVVARSRHRVLIAERWGELKTFLNPVAELLGARKADKSR
jgi:glyoxylase I family protein